MSRLSFRKFNVSSGAWIPVEKSLFRRAQYSGTEDWHDSHLFWQHYFTPACHTDATDDIESRITQRIVAASLPLACHKCEKWRMMLSPWCTCKLAQPQILAQKSAWRRKPSLCIKLKSSQQRVPEIKFSIQLREWYVPQNILFSMPPCLNRWTQTFSISSFGSLNINFVFCTIAPWHWGCLNLLLA